MSPAMEPIVGLNRASRRAAVAVPGFRRSPGLITTAPGLRCTAALRSARAPPMDRPTGITVVQRAANRRWAVSAASMIVSARVAAKSSHRLPWPGSRGTSTSNPASFRPWATGSMDAVVEVKPCSTSAPADLIASVLGSLLCAALAQPEDLQGVLDIGELVRCGELGGPGLQLRRLEFDGEAAAAAHQVMVMLLCGTDPEDRLTIVGPQRIEQPLLMVGLQDSVDGGQGHLLATISQNAVQLLSGDEILQRVQGCPHCALLAGAATPHR